MKCVGAHVSAAGGIDKAPLNSAAIGVCIDTAHAFAAGCDIRTPESFSEVFDAFEVIAKVTHLSFPDVIGESRFF